jgi:hypothetical protein
VIWALLGLIVLGCIVIVAVLVVRMGAKVIKRARPLTPELTAALEKVLPKTAPLRGELAFGERENPETGRGAGGLALYKEEIVFVRKAGGEALRVKLADLKDVTEIRAVSAMDASEDIVDTAPDYLLKLTWPGNEAAFVVHDSTDWVSAIAGARM